jgi:hypothetical protein
MQIFNFMFSGHEGRNLEGEMGMGGLYGHHGLTQRPESASSASPPSHAHFPASPPSHAHFPASPPSHHAHFPGFPTATSSAGMLVVPQPINASKVSGRQIKDDIVFPSFNELLKLSKLYYLELVKTGF